MLSRDTWFPSRNRLGIDLARGEDSTIVSRVRLKRDGTVEVLESVEVPAEPLFGPDSFLKRSIGVTLQMQARNIIDEMMPSIRRASYLHAHKGRKPKRGWPGR